MRSVFMSAFFVCGLCNSAVAAPLSNLIAGGTLTAGDVVFDNFVFTDNNVPPFTPLDFVPNPDNIDVSATLFADRVDLVFTLGPAASAQGVFNGSGGLQIPTGFEFFVDFDAQISAPSTRTFEGLSIGSGDLASTDNAEVEVEFVDMINNPLFDVALFSLDNSIVLTSDTEALPNLSAISLFGEIEGVAEQSNASASVGTFTLSFDLAGVAPTTPIPQPGGMPLLVGALAMGAFFRRRNIAQQD